MIPSIQGVSLRIAAGAIDIPLVKAAGGSGGDSPSDGEGLRSPKIGAPDIGAELELQPIREIAVRELLSKAKDGDATVHIPLKEATLKKGPLKIRVPKGTHVVINLVVRGGRIIREQCRGSFEPAIDLPLGLEFRGILIDDGGAIVADISPFPNIDLSWIKGSLRVPATLAEVLHMVFPDKNDDDAPTTKDKKESSVGIIADQITVSAWDIVPYHDAVDLGPFGHFALGAKTRLSAEFGPSRLAVSGRLEVTEASVRGRGFSVGSLTGSGDVEFVLQRGSSDKSSALRCHFDSVEAGAVEALLLDGSRASLSDVTAEDAVIRFSHGGAVHWAVAAKSFAGRSREGLFMLHLEGEKHEVTLGASSFDGSLAVADDRFDLDLAFPSLMISIGQHPLPLGIMHFDVVGSTADISGRLGLSSESGYRFEGTIKTDSVLSGGQFDLGPAKGEIDQGTRLQLEITSLKGMRGLSSVSASGHAAVVLRSAQLDLGEKNLGFSRGVVGELVMQAIELQEGKAWPAVHGSLELSTHIDPTTLNGVMELPGLQLHILSPSVVVSDDGHLRLSEVAVVGDPG